MTGIPFHPRRDLLVRSAAQPWTIHPTSAGMTGTPLRHLEGPACRVRCPTLDHPSHFGGCDRNAPPNGDGNPTPRRACCFALGPDAHVFFSEPKPSTLRPTGRCRSKGQLSRILGKLVDRCFPFRTYANTMEETTIEKLGPGLVGGADERREI